GGGGSGALFSQQLVVDQGGDDIPLQPGGEAYGGGVDGGGGFPRAPADGQMSSAVVAQNSGDGVGDGWNTGLALQQQLPGREHQQHGDGEQIGSSADGDSGGVIWGGMFALQLYAAYAPPSQVFQPRPGASFFLGDTGAVIHAVSNDEHVYHRRAPRRGETLLMVGDGECLPVSCFGDLDLV
ncbi:unnamed protein product, partial [Pylaiella littoralis]